MTQPTVAVVMLAYGEEPYLLQSVRAVLASTDVDLELVLVDNGTRGAAVDEVRALGDDRVRVVVPGRNTGFTGGVRLGVQSTTAPTLVLVNSDAIVEPQALSELVGALHEPGVGIVCGLVRLGDDPTTVNSVGNPVHLLGLSWAGHMGEPVTEHRTPSTIASATGALLAIPRRVWDELGGFPDEYFAYLEDMELSWRAWQRGYEVRYVPTAAADHFYEFSRSPIKMYLLDRNRLLFVLTCYEARTLALLAPALLAFDVALLAVAVAQGWGRQWLRARVWVATHRGWVAARRREVQTTRTRSDRQLAHLVTDRFSPAQFGLGPVAGILQALMHGYWVLVRRAL